MQVVSIIFNLFHKNNYFGKLLGKNIERKGVRKTYVAFFINRHF